MARYKVLVQSFINDALVAEGDIIELDDKAEVADNLALIVEPKEPKS
jgi:hypothetical protein